MSQILTPPIEDPEDCLEIGGQRDYDNGINQFIDLRRRCEISDETPQEEIPESLQSDLVDSNQEILNKQQSKVCATTCLGEKLKESNLEELKEGKSTENREKETAEILSDTNVNSKKNFIFECKIN